MRGTILISTAKAVEELGRLEEAIALLHEAEPYVDREREPRLYLCLRHNLMDYLSKSVRAEQAAALLPEVAALTQHAGGVTKHFWSCTLITLAVGWLGTISLILAPIYVVTNIVAFIKAKGQLRSVVRPAMGAPLRPT
jgi:hypothetical protein